MRRLAHLLVWSMFILLPLSACNSGTDGSLSADELSFSITLPQQTDVDKESRECVFSVSGGNNPLASDVFVLESEGGISYICHIISSSSENVTVQIPQDCDSGKYKVYVKRGDRKKSVGNVYLNFVTGLDFTPDKGTTIYGVVSSVEGPVSGVVVSDGIEVTTTNSRGIYQLASNKKWGYVFISVPSSYEVPSDGILPMFYSSLRSNADVTERVDFTLNKVSSQDDYKLFILGDMHLANRTNDAKQFMEFTSDLNSYRTLHQGTKMYALALGDMSWDYYWYSNSYALPEYINTMNSQVKDLQIFHVIGNHDFDYKATSDFEAGSKFRTSVAPLYYSFNIGKVHYIVMDDIDCSDYDGTTSRKYTKKLSTEQLDWLSKDLKYVDKTTPLVVAMHAPVFFPSQTAGFKLDHDATSTNRLLSLLSNYTVQFVSGHTHMSYTVTPDASVVGGRNFYEHNTAAICGSWWWSGYLTPGIHLSPDGAPGGYGIWDISGTNIQYIYKATGWSEDYQFRSYDLNNVHFSMADVPNMPTDISQSVKNEYLKYVEAYPQNSNNEVLINIWNWNDNWTLTVTDEHGKRLIPTDTWAYDPLHIAALSVKRFNSSSLKSTPSFITYKLHHFFKVKAADADTDLTITVKDEFGHVWTEQMQRPKVFSVDAYKAE